MVVVGSVVEGAEAVAEMLRAEGEAAVAAGLEARFAGQGHELERCGTQSAHAKPHD